MNRVWAYWENPPGRGMPPYLRGCLRNLRQFCERGGHEFTVLNEHGIERTCSHLHPNARRLKQIAHRADYYRACLLQEHGGVWLDVDRLLVSTLDPVFALLRDHDFVYANNVHGQPSIAFLGARPNCRAVRRWRRLIEEKLDHTGGHLRWAEIGSELLTTCIDPTKSFVLPTHRVLPISYIDHGVFYERRADLEVADDCLSICFYNALVPREIAWDENVLDSGILLANLIRKYTTDEVGNAT